MTWDDSDRARAEADFLRLPEDGNTATVVFVGEPKVVKRAGMRGGEVIRFYLPVLYHKGLKTWDVSGKTLDVIKALPNRGLGERYVITRHGAKGSSATAYALEVKPLSEDEQKHFTASGYMRAPDVPPAGQAGDDDDDSIPF